MWLELAFLGILSFDFLPNANCRREISITPATWEEVGFMVSVRKREPDSLLFGLGHECGGVLITMSIVLTRANCFIDKYPNDTYTILPKDEFYVVLGLMDKMISTNDTIIRSIARIVPHDNFEPVIHTNDIALIFLDEPVPGTHPYVRPILRSYVKIPTRTRCHLLEWHSSRQGSRENPLMKASISMLDFNDCLEVGSPIVNGFKDQLKDGMICAGPGEIEDADSCFGYMGGPLICSNLLVGIASRILSLDCNFLIKIYTDVGFYSSWIDEHTGENIKTAENSTSRLEYHFVTIVFIVGILVFRTYGKLFGRRKNIFKF